MSTTTARRPTRTRRPRRRGWMPGAGRFATKSGRVRSSSIRREAADAAGDVFGWLKARTTSQRCPHCETRTWVPRTEWAQHSRMHALANARQAQTRRRERQNAATAAARPEGRGRQRTSRTPRGPQPPGDADPFGVGENRPPAPGYGGARGKGPGPRPSTVHYVDDDGKRIDWTPGDPLPPNTGGADPWTPFDGEAERERLRNLHRQNRRQNSRVRKLGRWARERGGDYWRWQFPRPVTPERPAKGDGWKWKQRTTNPGGNPTGTRPPAPSRPSPPVAPVIPITPTTPVAPTGGSTPVSPTGTTGGGPVAGTGTRPGPRTKGGGGGGKPAGGGGGGGGSLGEIGAAASRWAQSPPEKLAQTKVDADNMGEALAALADGLVMRMNVETDRSISPSCVEPYQEAAQLVRQAQAKVEEVHSRLNQRYGEIADELAKPDTPDAEYLEEGRG